MAQMDLESSLKLLILGESVTLGDVARKYGMLEQDAERIIVAVLTTNPALGSFNAFTHTFTRANFPLPPIPPHPKKRRYWLIPVIISASLTCFMFLLLMLPLFLSG